MRQVTPAILLNHLPPYLAKETIISQNQGVFDIMQEIGKSHSLFAADYEKLAPFFDTGNLETTCKKLFDFCKINILYKVESEDKQSTRSASAILEIASGDCKHYSLFIAGTLDAIQRTTGKIINWSYRFSSYRFWDKIPHHVFVVVTMPTGREIWIDPVLSYFNEKKLYSSSITKKFNVMPLVRLSGTDDSSGDIGKVKVFKKVFAAVKKVSVAPARNGFLALVGLNIHGMASKLLPSVNDKARSAKLRALWEKLGGNYSKLTGTIIKGAKKKKILGINDTTMISGYRIAGSSVGVVMTIPAILAAAAPIIAALSQFMKGGGAAEGGEKLEDLVNSAITTTKQEILSQPAPDTYTGSPGGAVPFAPVEPAEPGEKKTFIPGVPNMVLFAGGGLALYMLSKKR